jgi:hypothetical protein
MSGEARKVSGGCLCGQVRYEAEILSDKAYYCHCTICQKSSGQPFEIGVPVRLGTLRFTSAEPKYYVSTAWGRRGFCPDCGSRIVWRPTDPENEWSTNLSPGSLDKPDEVRPCIHIYVDTRLAWFDTHDGLPRVAEEDMGPVIAGWKEDWQRN